jgi:hypothetical protein
MIGHLLFAIGLVVALLIGSPTEEMDFFGNTGQGVLLRVERLKAGMFWHVWSEFYPGTVNRVV